MNIIYLFDFMENDINDEVVNSIIEYINTQPKIMKYFNMSYKSQQYKLSQLLPIIMYVLKHNISWRCVSDLKISGSIHWNTVYKMHQRLIQLDVYKNSYEKILGKFYKKTKHE